MVGSVRACAGREAVRRLNGGRLQIVNFFYLVFCAFFTTGRQIMCKSLNELARRALARALAGGLFLAVTLVAAQSTQTNQVWVTDDGSAYFESNGVFSLNPRKLAEAQRLPECQPAELDPAGNWGTPGEGFQISLRLPKATYGTNEPIAATVITRNLTTNQIYFTVGMLKSLEVVASRGGQPLRTKEEIGMEKLPPFQRELRAMRSHPHDWSVAPRTQSSETIRLDELFDLSVAGDYSVQVTRRVRQADGKGTAEVESGTAAFRILSTNAVAEPLKR
jgi:hypothetical protein